jgi:hypothetical protein
LGGCRLCGHVLFCEEGTSGAPGAPGLLRFEFPVGRPGDDRLSRVLGRSTIGAEGFHGRVRNGIGCWAPRYDHQVVRPEGRRGGSCSKEDGGVSGTLARVREKDRKRKSAFALSRVTIRRRIEIKPIERLGPVGSTHCCAFTPGLSTWWSSTALKRDLVLRGVSRLDAFSGYPVRT